jgi:hypothetical protein
MATYKNLEPSDIKTAKSFLSQLIDIIQEDISGSTSRRKYQVFVTGGIGPGITSSLFQTVYDQDFSLQTSNQVFDCTIGLFPNSDIVSSSLAGVDSVGKELFPSSSIMMREKMDNYRQFSQLLLGDADSQFVAPYGSAAANDKIDAAFFVAFKRLFSRDQIKRESFAMRFYQSASLTADSGGPNIANLYKTSELGVSVYTDIGSSNEKFTEFGGQFGNVVDAADTSRTVGLMFYDRGIAILDLEKITSASQFVTGTIDAMTPTGFTVLGAQGTETAGRSKFIPDFIVSASIDNVVDHICATRFSSGSQTAITFQNTTNINSTLIFCRAAADEFNYSSNPTFTDSNNRIVVIDPGEEVTQQTFTFVTSVGLYDANDNLLAVAKLSRPVEKSPERDLTFRVRLDFAKKKSRSYTK